MEMSQSNNFSPFVVFGASKSGTTWLQRLLDSHPEIRCHFQIPIFPLKDQSLWVSWKPYRVGSKSPFQGVFKDDVGEQNYRRIHDMFYNLEILQPEYVKSLSNNANGGHGSQAREVYLRIIRAMIQGAMIDTPGKRIYGTKAYTNLRQLFSAYPNSKVVHIVRDGRDVCVSKRFHLLRMGVFYPGEERSQWLKLIKRLPFGQRAAFIAQNRFRLFNTSAFLNPGKDSPLFTHGSLNKLASEWSRINQYINLYKLDFPGKFIEVRYEDLKQAPVETLGKVCAFLDADPSSALMDRINEENSFKRLKKGKDSFFRKGTSGDWRNYFNSEDVIRFKSIAGDMLIDLGYETMDDWD